MIVSNYQPGARWRRKPISAGQGVLELLNNTVPARRKPAVVLPTLQHAVTGAIIAKCARGEAEETARLILKK